MRPALLVLLLGLMIEHETKPDNVLERVLFAGALAALANRERAHVDGELGELAMGMLRRWRPRAQA